MKTPVVFSLVREQSVFMTAIMSLLTFLAVMALGVVLSIGTGVVRWNSQWDLMATVQITKSENESAVKKIIDENAAAIVINNEITSAQMQDLMRPWISGGNALENYLPKMYELKFKNRDAMKSVGDSISQHARFLTHATALRAPVAAGWRMMMIAGLVLALVLGAIAVCISYIARNTAMLHRRELEILNQIGATDSFVAKQMQIIVAKICTAAAVAGFVVAAPMLGLVIWAAHSARVGLMAMMGLSGTTWVVLMMMPVAIVIFAICITRRTTLNILKDN